MPFGPLLAFPLALATSPADFGAVVAPRPPKIDGHVRDHEWPEAARRQGFSDAQTGQASDAKGEFWLMYDEGAIYFAGRVKQNPKTVVDQEFRQNVSLGGNDRMTLMVDPFGDGTNPNSFSVNAQGATEIDLAGGRAAKTEWVGEFEASGRKTGDGWEFEARIPWAIMNLPAAGTRKLRTNVRWDYIANNSSLIHHFTSKGILEWPFWGPVATPSPPKSKEVKLLPYAYAGVDADGKGVSNAGLDLRASLTDRITAVATVNPDFRNIENSILSLDFSYFGRLAGESRPFFQEGNQFRGVGSRLYATQKIRDIDLGLNVYGQLDDKRQVGGMVALDFGKHATVTGSYLAQPSKNSDWTASYVGDSTPGNDNHVVAAQFNHRFGNMNLFAVGRVSQDTADKTGLGQTFGLNYNKDGFETGVSTESMSASFSPRAGFLPDRDYHMVNTWMGVSQRYKRGPFNRAFFNAYVETYTRSNGAFYHNSANVFAFVNLRNGLGVDLSIDRTNWQGSADQSSSAGLSYPSTDPYNNVSVNRTVARYGGADYTSTSANLNWRPLKRVQASLSGQFVEFGGPQAQVVGSLRFDKGKHESFGLRLVRQDSDLNWTLSYRMSGKKGNEYFLILGDPNSRTFQRQLVLKLVAPLTLG